MAKESKARVRVFFGEIEGDNETIRDGLRSIAAAVNKTFQTGPAIVKMLTVDSNVTEQQLVEQVEEQLASETVAESSDDGAYVSNGEATASQRKKARSQRTLSLVKDLNLQPDDKPSLRDFWAEKKAKGQPQQLTVILYYLHRVLEISKISCDHVYTAMKDVEMRVPNNLPQAFYNIANRKGWIDASKTDGLRTTIAGDNLVEKDLGVEKVTANGDEEA